MKRRDRRSRRFFPAAMILSSILAALLAALLPAASLAAADSAGDTFRFSGDRTSIVLTRGQERTILSGNARIISDKIEVTASEIELYGEDFRYAVCRGNVRAVNRQEQIDLTSERLYLDRELDITRAQGNAEMEDRQEEIIVKGDFIEHREQEDITIVQIGVRILREDMASRSEFARYRRGEKILELSGMPVVHWKGDVYRAARIIINTETDEIELIGQVSGSVRSEKKESPGTVPSEPSRPAGGNPGTAAPAAEGPAAPEGPVD